MLRSLQNALLFVSLAVSLVACSHSPTTPRPVDDDPQRPAPGSPSNRLPASAPAALPG
jgi:hypothetical protein